MCKEGWSGCKVWGARGKIETLVEAYFGHWYLSLISSLPRLLTTVGVWEAHSQHVLGVCSYLLHSAAMACLHTPYNKLLIFKKKGLESVEIGHHFGGPINHFWPCPYESGLTCIFLAPTCINVFSGRFGNWTFTTYTGLYTPKSILNRHGVIFMTRSCPIMDSSMITIRRISLIDPPLKLVLTTII